MGTHKPETRKRLNAEYRKRHKIKIQRQRKLARKSIKEEVLKQYGTCCAVCGFSDSRALQIDHIDNDGGAERKLLGGRYFAGFEFYCWLKKQGWPSGYQTLCANHNLIKYFEHKSANHLKVIA